MSVALDMKSFAERLGIEDSGPWEFRLNECVSGLHDKEITTRMAGIINNALETVEGPYVQVVKSRSSEAYRVLVPHAGMYNIFVQDWFQKNPPPTK